jgi:hypothetical protein
LPFDFTREFVATALPGNEGTARVAKPVRAGRDMGSEVEASRVRYHQVTVGVNVGGGRGLSRP